MLISTPVYKASFAGGLKAVLDLLDEKALAGKVVLPIATGGSPAHLLALEYGLKPVLSALGARHILAGVYATDKQVRVDEAGQPHIDDDVRQRLEDSGRPAVRTIASACLCRHEAYDLGRLALAGGFSVWNRKPAHEPISAIRRALLRGLLGLLGAALLAPAAQAQDGKTLRIGFQKYGTLTIVKALGTLDKRLAEQGVTVKWTEFPAGPQLLEGLNVGSIDFGTVGEAPPIFAQAAGAALVYVGSEPAAPASEAILVPMDSAAARCGRPEGQKGRAEQGLERALPARQAAGARGRGLPRRERGLPHAVGRARRLRARRDRRLGHLGSVPGRRRETAGARVLADGAGVVKNYQFFPRQRLREAHPQIIQTVLDEVRKGDLWARDHRAESVALLQPVLGLDREIVELAASRLAYGVQPITREVLLEQQGGGRLPCAQAHPQTAQRIPTPLHQY